MKICSRCKICQPIENFTNDRKRKDGKNVYCRSCTRAASKSYGDANPEKARERGRRWVANNQERQRARTMRWREENKERSDAWQRDYRRRNSVAINADQAVRRAANPEYEKARAASYYKRNKTAALIKSAEREALKLRATPAWADFERMRAQYVVSEIVTQITGVRHNVDHIVPLRHTLVCGLHVHHNLNVLTETENKSKGNRHWPDMP